MSDSAKDSIDREQVASSKDAARWVMSSVAGRRFVCDILMELHFLRRTYASDPHDHAFNAGQAEAARLIYVTLDDLQPELVRRMWEERQERLDAAERRSKG